MHCAPSLLLVPFFADRNRKAEAYPWLVWKVRLFSAGAVLVVAGIVMEEDWVMWLAIGVLVAAFMVRFLPGGTGARERRGAREDDQGEETAS